MYGIARKLARVYRPFNLDFEDTVQEYVITGWLALGKYRMKWDKVATLLDDKELANIHWGYVKKSMYNRFLELIESNQKKFDRHVACTSENIEDLEIVCYDLVFIEPEDGDVRDMIVALTSYPTATSAKHALNICNRTWDHKCKMVRDYIHENTL